MPLQHIAPRAVAERCGTRRRVDDVGEQDGRQHAVGVAGRTHAGHELLDLVQHDVLVADPRDVVVARQLEEPRVRDVAGDPAALVDTRLAVTGAVHDERRHVDRRQHVPNVDLRVHPQ
jgi:hypothetical protein